MDDSTEGVTIFRRCAAWYTVEICPPKKLSNVFCGPPGTSDHPPFLHLFSHGFLQNFFPVVSRHGVVVLDVSLRLWRLILEMAYETCREALHPVVFHFVLDQVLI